MLSLSRARTHTCGCDAGISATSISLPGCGGNVNGETRQLKLGATTTPVVVVLVVVFDVQDDVGDERDRAATISPRYPRTDRDVVAESYTAVSRAVISSSKSRRSPKPFGPAGSISTSYPYRCGSSRARCCWLCLNGGGATRWLADYYLNGYWYDSAYLRVVHHGANSTLVILISGIRHLSPHPLGISACRVPPVLSARLYNLRTPGSSVSLSSRFPPFLWDETRRINVCFQDFWLSAE